MRYTQSEIGRLASLFQEWNEERNQLEAFLEPVAKGLELEYVWVKEGSVKVNTDEITFLAEYESLESDPVSFPARLLEEGTDAIVTWIKEKQRREHEERSRKWEAESKERRRKEYDKLRDEFESTNSEVKP